MNGLIFVTAGSCRSQLARLTQMLIFSFPGSTIYQHTDPLRVPHDVVSHKVDAVLLEAELEKTSGLDLMQQLRRQKPELPVFLFSKTNHLREKAAAAGATGYFVMPKNEEPFLNAIRLLKSKEHVS